MKNESGNVLFFILIGVVLYAALSFTITKSDSNSNLDAQSVFALSNNFIQYGNAVKQGVARVRAQNGCVLEQISFDRSPFDGSYSGGAYLNPNSPPDYRCHVFHPDGGNVEDKTAYFADQMSFDILNYVVGSGMPGVGTWNCGDTSCTEMYMFGIAQTNRDEDYCTAYNRILGHDHLIPRISKASVVGGTPWQGTLTVTHDNPYAEFFNIRAYCHEYVVTPNRDFYVFTLMER